MKIEQQGYSCIKTCLVSFQKFPPSVINYIRMKNYMKLRVLRIPVHTYSSEAGKITLIIFPPFLELYNSYMSA